MSPDRVCCQNYYHDSIAVKQHGVMSMPVVTVRNLPEETHRALKVRAAEHGRSTEAEIREILEEAVRPATRIKIASELAAFGERLGGLDVGIAKDKWPIRPSTFE